MSNKSKHKHEVELLAHVLLPHPPHPQPPATPQHQPREETQVMSQSIYSKLQPRLAVVVALEEPPADLVEQQVVVPILLVLGLGWEPLLAQVLRVEPASVILTSYGITRNSNSYVRSCRHSLVCWSQFFNKLELAIHSWRD